MYTQNLYRVPIVEVKDYISIDDILLRKYNAFMTSDMVKCNEDDSSEEETDQHDEEHESIHNPTYEKVWKTINNLKMNKKKNK